MTESFASPGDIYAHTDEPKREVRRCARCSEPAVIVCQAWDHIAGRPDTGYVTRDCRCQACGYSITLPAPGQLRMLRIIGYLLLITIFIGPILLFKAWSGKRAWEKTPLVPGAPFPEIRFWRGPGPRRCAKCGQVARLLKITRHTTNGIPTGTDCKYECPGCKAKFTTESAGGIAVNVFGFLMFAIGGGFWLADSVAKQDWPKAAIGALVIAMGLFLGWLAVSRVMAAIKNRPVLGLSLGH